MARVASLRLSLHLTLVQSPSSGSRQRGFSLLGFPTVVRPGFPLFVVLIAFLYPWPLGAWIGVTIALFTVVHELGHALVARAFGCEARISLDFMVAYAAFSPAPGLTRTRKALIAMSGATVQVALAFAILAAMRVNPFSRADILSSEAATAVWWTGLALGVVNLVPLVPLDGGAVVANILDSLFPGSGQKIMLRFSVVASSTVLAVMLITGHSDLLFFFAFLLFLQWRTLRTEKTIALLVSQAAEHPMGVGPIDSLAASELVDHGDPSRALEYCRESWLTGPSPDVAVVAARAACALGSFDAALDWVEAAVDTSFDDLDVHARLNTAGEIDAIRLHPRYVQLVGRLSIND